MASNNFWVDPDGLERQGTPYHWAAADFRALHVEIDDILSRYPDAFGGDELGVKFRGPFMKGVEGIRGRINLVANRLEYTGEGLVTTGREFRRAERDATDVSEKLQTGIEDRIDQYGQSPPVAFAASPVSDLEDPQFTPRMYAQALPGIPARPAGYGYMTSSFFMSTEFAKGSITIDGRPVPEGYRLLGANEISDGRVRMTVDGFESIVPLPTRHVVTVGGEPIGIEDGTQLFLVKDEPDRDEPLPADERTYVEFHRDGTAVPYQPEG
jgi:hypothetical protein